MGFKTKTVAAVLLASFAATACATKGALRDAMNQQQQALEAGLQAERSARTAADQQLQSDLAQLRSDLESLRTNFNAKIDSVAMGLQFVLPVHFAFDEADVRPTDASALEAFTSIVNKHYAGSTITVEGFTDPSGSASYNKRLSERRAEAVRDQLMNAGIQAQVRAIGYGENRLVVPGAAKDESGAELNRRVVFVIETPGQGAPMGVTQQGG